MPPDPLDKARINGARGSGIRPDVCQAAHYSSAEIIIAAERSEAALPFLSPGLRDLLVAFDQNKICRSVVLSFFRFPNL